MKNRSDLKRVAPLILQCADIWENAEHWEWNLSLISDDHNEMKSRQQINAKLHRNLHPWLKVLRAHFAPQRRDDWFKKHICVRNFWRQLQFDEAEPRRGTIKANRLDSAHEQLEAKLALREWLRDKATPAVIEQLLGGLEA